MLAIFVSRLTVLSIVVSLFPLGKNIQYFLHSTHFLEECTYNIHHDQDHSLLQYPCFYLELWMNYIHGEIYDNRIFLDTFCIATIILTSIYIITSILASYGIVNENWYALVPWILANIVISMIISIMMAAELHMMIINEDDFHLSQNFLINIFSAFYLTFNWIVGLIIIEKIKKYPKVGEDECSRITYIELQNLNDDL